ncbi:MAG: tetratricopeptide repeat protein [Bacteroidales bacterium]|nr:tetratricopeptide repeat protein [Bacteroidales bacterium]
MRKLKPCQILVVFLLLLFLSFCKTEVKEEKIPVTTKSETAKELYMKAYKAGEQVELAKARNLYEKALIEDPDFFMAYYQMATYDLYFGNEESFKEYAGKAVECEYDLSKGEELLKNALEKFLEDTKADATEIGEELVSIYPKDKDAYFYLYFFQYIIGNYEGGVLTLKKVIEIAENQAPIYNTLGYAYIQLEQFEDAKSAFDKYIELEPNLPNPYDSKGDYFMKVEEYGKAYESFMKAYDLDTTWMASYNKAMKAKEMLDSLQQE